MCRVGRVVRRECALEREENGGREDGEVVQRKLGGSRSCRLLDVVPDV